MAPFYCGRGRLLPFLAGLLLPALGFLRHCLLSPPSCGFDCASAHAHLCGCRLARSPDVGTRRFEAPSASVARGGGASSTLMSSFTRDGDEFTTLIPDID